jgi:hypothetical protein
MSIMLTRVGDASECLSVAVFFIKIVGGRASPSEVFKMVVWSMAMPWLFLDNLEHILEEEKREEPNIKYY